MKSKTIILSNLNGGKITTAIIKSIIVTIKDIKNKVLFNLDSFIKSHPNKIIISFILINVSFML